jgi:hypothetical protein
VREIASEEDAVTFAIESRGRRAIVDPPNAMVSARVDTVSTSKAACDADPRQRGLLERHGLVNRNWFWTDSVRYTEAVIAIDQAITVLGNAIREPRAGSGARAGCAVSRRRGDAAAVSWLGEVSDRDPRRGLAGDGFPTIAARVILPRQLLHGGLAW